MFNFNNIYQYIKNKVLSAYRFLLDEPSQWEIAQYERYGPGHGRQRGIIIQGYLNLENFTIQTFISIKNQFTIASFCSKYQWVSKKFRRGYKGCYNFVSEIYRTKILGQKPTRVLEFWEVIEKSKNLPLPPIKTTEQIDYKDDISPKITNEDVNFYNRPNIVWYEPRITAPDDASILVTIKNPLLTYSDLKKETSVDILHESVKPIKKNTLGCIPIQQTSEELKTASYEELFSSCKNELPSLESTKNRLRDYRTRLSGEDLVNGKEHFDLIIKTLNESTNYIKLLKSYRARAAANLEYKVKFLEKKRTSPLSRSFKLIAQPFEHDTEGHFVKQKYIEFLNEKYRLLGQEAAATNELLGLGAKLMRHYVYLKELTDPTSVSRMNRCNEKFNAMHGTYAHNILTNYINGTPEWKKKVYEAYKKETQNPELTEKDFDIEIYKLCEFRVHHANLMNELIDEYNERVLDLKSEIEQIYNNIDKSILALKTNLNESAQLHKLSPAYAYRDIMEASPMLEFTKHLEGGHHIFSDKRLQAVSDFIAIEKRIEMLEYQFSIADSKIQTEIHELIQEQDKLIHNAQENYSSEDYFNLPEVEQSTFVTISDEDAEVTVLEDDLQADFIISMRENTQTQHFPLVYTPANYGVESLTVPNPNIFITSSSSNKPEYDDYDNVDMEADTDFIKREVFDNAAKSIENIFNKDKILSQGSSTETTTKNILFKSDEFNEKIKNFNTVILRLYNKNLSFFQRYNNFNEWPLNRYLILDIPTKIPNPKLHPQRDPRAFPSDENEDEDEGEGEDKDESPFQTDPRVLFEMEFEKELKKKPKKMGARRPKDYQPEEEYVEVIKMHNVTQEDQVYYNNYRNYKSGNYSAMIYPYASPEVLHYKSHFSKFYADMNTQTQVKVEEKYDDVREFASKINEIDKKYNDLNDLNNKNILSSEINELNTNPFHVASYLSNISKTKKETISSFKLMYKHLYQNGLNDIDPLVYKLMEKLPYGPVVKSLQFLENIPNYSIHKKNLEISLENYAPTNILGISRESFRNILHYTDASAFCYPGSRNAYFLKLDIEQNILDQYDDYKPISQTELLIRFLDVYSCYQASRKATYNAIYFQNNVDLFKIPEYHLARENAMRSLRTLEADIRSEHEEILDSNLQPNTEELHVLRRRSMIFDIIYPFINEFNRALTVEVDNNLANYTTELDEIIHNHNLNPYNYLQLPELGFRPEPSDEELIPEISLELSPELSSDLSPELGFRRLTSSHEELSPWFSSNSRSLTKNTLTPQINNNNPLKLVSYKPKPNSIILKVSDKERLQLFKKDIFSLIFKLNVINEKLETDKAIIETNYNEKSDLISFFRHYVEDPLKLLSELELLNRLKGYIKRDSNLLQESANIVCKPILNASFQLNNQLSDEFAVLQDNFKDNQNESKAIHKSIFEMTVELNRLFKQYETTNVEIEFMYDVNDSFIQIYSQRPPASTQEFNDYTYNKFLTMQANYFKSEHPDSRESAKFLGEVKNPYWEPYSLAWEQLSRVMLAKDLQEGGIDFINQKRAKHVEDCQVKFKTRLGRFLKKYEDSLHLLDDIYFDKIFSTLSLDKDDPAFTQYIDTRNTNKILFSQPYINGERLLKHYKKMFQVKQKPNPVFSEKPGTKQPIGPELAYDIKILELPTQSVLQKEDFSNTSFQSNEPPIIIKPKSGFMFKPKSQSGFIVKPKSQSQSQSNEPPIIINSIPQSLKPKPSRLITSTYHSLSKEKKLLIPLDPSLTKPKYMKQLGEVIDCLINYKQSLITPVEVPVLNFDEPTHTKTIFPSVIKYLNDLLYSNTLSSLNNYKNELNLRGILLKKISQFYDITKDTILSQSDPFLVEISEQHETVESSLILHEVDLYAKIKQKTFSLIQLMSDAEYDMSYLQRQMVNATNEVRRLEEKRSIYGLTEYEQKVHEEMVDNFFNYKKRYDRVVFMYKDYESKSQAILNSSGLAKDIDSLTELYNDYCKEILDKYDVYFKKAELIFCGVEDWNNHFMADSLELVCKLSKLVLERQDILNFLNDSKKSNFKKYVNKDVIDKIDINLDNITAECLTLLNRHFNKIEEHFNLINLKKRVESWLQFNPLHCNDLRKYATQETIDACNSHTKKVEQLLNIISIEPDFIYELKNTINTAIDAIQVKIDRGNVLKNEMVNLNSNTPIKAQLSSVMRNVCEQKSIFNDIKNKHSIFIENLTNTLISTLSSQIPHLDKLNNLPDLIGHYNNMINEHDTIVYNIINTANNNRKNNIFFVSFKDVDRRTDKVLNEIKKLIDSDYTQLKYFIFPKPPELLAIEAEIAGLNNKHAERFMRKFDITLTEGPRIINLIEALQLKLPYDKLDSYKTNLFRSVIGINSKQNIDGFLYGSENQLMQDFNNYVLNKNDNIKTAFYHHQYLSPENLSLLPQKYRLKFLNYILGYNSFESINFINPILIKSLQKLFNALTLQKTVRLSPSPGCISFSHLRYYLELRLNIIPVEAFLTLLDSKLFSLFPPDTIQPAMAYGAVLRQMTQRLSTFSVNLNLQENEREAIAWFERIIKMPTYGHEDIYRDLFDKLNFEKCSLDEKINIFRYFFDQKSIHYSFQERIISEFRRFLIPLVKKYYLYNKYINNTKIRERLKLINTVYYKLKKSQHFYIKKTAIIKDCSFERDCREEPIILTNEDNEASYRLYLPKSKYTLSRNDIFKIKKIQLYPELQLYFFKYYNNFFKFYNNLAIKIRDTYDIYSRVGGRFISQLDLLAYFNILNHIKTFINDVKRGFNDSQKPVHMRSAPINKTKFIHKSNISLKKLTIINTKHLEEHPLINTKHLEENLFKKSTLIFNKKYSREGTVPFGTLESDTILLRQYYSNGRNIIKPFIQHYQDYCKTPVYKIFRYDYKLGYINFNIKLLNLENLIPQMSHFNIKNVRHLFETPGSLLNLDILNICKYLKDWNDLLGTNIPFTDIYKFFKITTLNRLLQAQKRWTDIIERQHTDLELDIDFKILNILSIQRLIPQIKPSVIKYNEIITYNSFHEFLRIRYKLLLDNFLLSMLFKVEDVFPYLDSVLSKVAAEIVVRVNDGLRYTFKFVGLNDNLTQITIFTNTSYISFIHSILTECKFTNKKGVYLIPPMLKEHIKSIKKLPSYRHKFSFFVQKPLKYKKFQKTIFVRNDTKCYLITEYKLNPSYQTNHDIYLITGDNKPVQVFTQLNSYKEFLNPALRSLLQLDFGYVKISDIFYNSGLNSKFILNINYKIDIEKSLSMSPKTGFLTTYNNSTNKNISLMFADLFKQFTDFTSISGFYIRQKFRQSLYQYFKLTELQSNLSFLIQTFIKKDKDVDVLPQFTQWFNYTWFDNQMKLIAKWVYAYRQRELLLKIQKNLYKSLESYNIVGTIYAAPFKKINPLAPVRFKERYRFFVSNKFDNSPKHITSSFNKDLQLAPNFVHLNIKRTSIKKNFELKALKRGFNTIEDVDDFLLDKTNYKTINKLRPQFIKFNYFKNIIKNNIFKELDSHILKVEESILKFIINTTTLKMSKSEVSTIALKLINFFKNLCSKLITFKTSLINEIFEFQVELGREMFKIIIRHYNSIHFKVLTFDFIARSLTTQIIIPIYQFTAKKIKKVGNILVQGNFTLRDFINKLNVNKEKFSYDTVDNGLKSWLPYWNKNYSTILIHYLWSKANQSKIKPLISSTPRETITFSNGLVLPLAKIYKHAFILQTQQCGNRYAAFFNIPEIKFQVTELMYFLFESSIKLVGSGVNLNLPNLNYIARRAFLDSKNCTGGIITWHIQHNSLYCQLFTPTSRTQKKIKSRKLAEGISIRNVNSVYQCGTKVRYDTDITDSAGLRQMVFRFKNKNQLTLGQFNKFDKFKEIDQLYEILKKDKLDLIDTLKKVKLFKFKNPNVTKFMTKRKKQKMDYFIHMANPNSSILKVKTPVKTIFDQGLDWKIYKVQSTYVPTFLRSSKHIRSTIGDFVESVDQTEPLKIPADEQKNTKIIASQTKDITLSIKGKGIMSQVYEVISDLIKNDLFSWITFQELREELIRQQNDITPFGIMTQCLSAVTQGLISGFMLLVVDFRRAPNSKKSARLVFCKVIVFSGLSTIFAFCLIHYGGIDLLAELFKLSKWVFGRQRIPQPVLHPVHLNTTLDSFDNTVFHTPFFTEKKSDWGFTETFDNVVKISKKIIQNIRDINIDDIDL